MTAYGGSLALLFLVGFHIAVGVLVLMWFESTAALAFASFVGVFVVWCLGSCAFVWCVDRRLERRVDAEVERFVARARNDQGPQR